MLDPRLIALQGLGVPLTPIAIAVQGLIAQIQEEARRDEYHGGGGRRSALAPSPAAQRLAARELTEAEVRAQWELLELRQRNQREDAAHRRAETRELQTAPAVSPALPPAAQPAAATPAVQSQQEIGDRPAQIAEQQLEEEELALLLLLADA